jgi:hypothetical protein
MSKLSYEYDSSTGAVVTVQWSGLGDTAARKRTFGGQISHWKARRIGEFTYLVPPQVTIEDIDGALVAALLESDRAVLTYPHGKSAAGASAMRVRLYGKAAGDAREG